MPDGLLAQLESRRDALSKETRAALEAPVKENRAATADEEQRWKTAQEELGQLRERIEFLKTEAEREERAKQARAGDAGVADDHGSGARASGVQVVSEPQVYDKLSQHSYWLDLARDQMGRGADIQGARERLGRHAAELRVELPKRQERRARLARERLEGLHTGSRQEERALEHMLGSGVPMFETRAINRTDGTGGYFVPPLWVIEEYAPYLRAGRVLANLCRSVPLPPGTDSINLPRITTGAATGVQTADGNSVPSRDMADNYSNALVRTIAGQEDVAIQLLDQSPIAFDSVISQDLMADHAMQLDGQVLLGSGSSGQLTGLYSHGTITGGSTEAVIVNTVTGTTTAQWVGTNSFYVGAGALMSTIARNRFRPVTAVCSNPAVWYALATAADGNARPLVVPSIQGPWNAVADFAPGQAAEGPVGSILGRPWYLDANIPLTFGGATTNPSMSTTSAGHTSPTDGTGSGDTFTPFLAGVWDDILLFEGDIRTRVLQEVLSGTLQVRFQVYSYVAFMKDRYQDSNSRIVSYGNANSGTTAGAALSTGSSGGLVGF